MLSGATWSAAAIVGTPVFRMVVSRDSIKNATAMSHGSSSLLEAASDGCEEGASIGLGGPTFVGDGCMNLRDRVHQSSIREDQLSPIRASISSRQVWFTFSTRCLISRFRFRFPQPRL